MKKVIFISATEYALEHFAGCYVNALHEHGDDVSVFCGREIGSYTPPEGVEKNSIELLRAPSPIKDFLALCKLVVAIRKVKPDVVYSISPKGGLIGQLAAFLSRVPVRVHFITGQVWRTEKRPVVRFGLRMLDKVIGLVSTNVLVDSKTQLSFLEDMNVLRKGHGDVLGSGSVSGIAVEKYRFSSENRASIRSQYGFTDNDLVVLFLGRVSPVKGVTDLVKAFNLISDSCPDLKLLLIGPDDGDLVNVQAEIAQSKFPLSIVTDWNSTIRPAPHYSAAEIFCLPSYMEGFGNVILEAACAGIPAVGSDIYGLQDAIADGETGLLFTCGDVEALAGCLKDLYSDRDKIKKLGSNALNRVESEFSEEYVVSKFIEFHDSK